MKVLSYIVLISLYLVIVAGGVVRMTGSGMGCPDWPKCFGYIVPPTEESQVQFQTNTFYPKGRMIVVRDTLWEAKTNLTTDSIFQSKNWKPFTKHSYTIFNPYNTWVEYINRLFGALAGLFVMSLVLLAFKNRKQYPGILSLSLLLFVAIGFQGWLGAVVVETVLAPVMITIHMLMALILVIINLEIIRNLEVGKGSPILPKSIINALFALIGISLIQILLGTQVREEVDTLFEHNSNRASVIDSLSLVYIVHRTLSYSFIILSVYSAWKFRSLSIHFPKSYILSLSMIAISFLTGLTMAWFEIPAFSQALHLVSGSILFGGLYYTIRIR